MKITIEGPAHAVDEVLFAVSGGEKPHAALDCYRAWHIIGDDLDVGSEPRGLIRPSALSADPAVIRIRDCSAKIGLVILICLIATQAAVSLALAFVGHASWREGAKLPSGSMTSVTSSVPVSLDKAVAAPRRSHKQQFKVSLTVSPSVGWGSASAKHHRTLGK